MNDVTEHDRRYELVELKMELANSGLPKSLLKIFNSNSNSNSTHFDSIPIQFQFRFELTPALHAKISTLWFSFVTVDALLEHYLQGGGGWMDASY